MWKKVAASCFQVQSVEWLREKTKISEDSQAGVVTSGSYCSVNEVFTVHFSGMLCYISW